MREDVLMRVLACNRALSSPEGHSVGSWDGCAVGAWTG